ncbi:hypothetical protein GLW04_19165 [Halobacillus litoralis]|uniref:DUF1832 domain-containing protein n=1 Tax=Halobacillus litoralis TaxID=45668 RepID=A0A845E789_9BACI|nr:hypothetical protein [Halobacillus litoralis]MYL21997.1 hypothetical protein [Halobacillus litoralis]
MSNKKMNLSYEGKQLLENTIDSLDLERATVIKVALAKGISAKDEFEFDSTSTPKWTIPEGLIKDTEYLMFKQLIIEKEKKTLNDLEIQNYFLKYIEKGIRILNMNINSKNSLEDTRFVII